MRTTRTRPIKRFASNRRAGSCLSICCYRLLANRQYDYTVAAALAEKTHTKAVVAENKTWQDALAGGRQTLQNGINAAMWTRERAIADLDYDLAWDIIDSTAYAAQSRTPGVRPPNCSGNAIDST